MKIGILTTGHVNEMLVDEFGEYPPMFEDLFRRTDPTLEFESWAVVEGVFPENITSCDAWLVTGSKFGVYDPEPWIEPLKSMLRDIRAAGLPIIGICFGHQIVAEAFGGRAGKSDKGWGAGAHNYEIVSRPGWMANASPRFAMHAMHQDQVTDLPEDAVILARSEFCPIAMAAYGDPEVPDAISLQPHPEFMRDYAEALVNLRADLIGGERIDAVRGSFGGPIANDEFVRWALDYLAAFHSQRAAA